MKKKFLSILSLILALTMIFPMGISVSADTTGGDAAPEITLKILDSDKNDLTGKTSSVWYYKENDTFTLTPECSEANAKDFAWGTSNTSVATVSNGVVSPVGDGSVKIFLTYKDKTVDTTIEFVKIRCTKIEITKNPTKTTYIEGQKIDLTGIEVTATYNDNSTGKLDVSKLNVEPAGALKISDKQFRVKYGDIASQYVDITVNEQQVTSVKLASSTSNTYTEGDTIPKFTLIVTNNDNTTLELTAGYTITVDGKEVKSGDKFTKEQNGKQLVISFGGKSTDPMNLIVKTKTEEPKPDTNEYKVEVKTTGTLTKKEYKEKEKYTTAGVSVLINIVDNKGTIVEQYEVPTATLDGKFNKTFDASDVGKTFSSMSVTFKINSVKMGQVDVTVEINQAITVVSSATTLDVYEITDVVFDNDKYPINYKLSLSDIEYIKYREKNSRGDIKTVLFRELADITNDLEIDVLDKDGDKKRTRYNVIEEGDVLTDYRDRSYVKVRFSIDRDYYDATLYVGESSKVQFIYDGDLITSYDDLDEALKYTAEQDKNVKFELDRVRDTRSITLKLGEDQKYRIREFNDLCHNVIIDLNGHSMTMDSDAINISSDNRDYTLIITNSSSTAAKFTYYDESLTLTLNKGDTLEFKYDRDTKKTTVPGIYSVEVTCGANGTYSSTPKSDSKDVITTAHGAEIRFTFTPKAGYQIDAVVVGGKAVAEKDYTVSSSGIVTYTLKNITENTIVRATFKEQNPLANWNNPFTDVSERNSYYEAVAFVYQNELFKGTSTDKFSPNTSMTRAMFVTVLGRLAGANVSRYSGKSSFTDVDKDPKNSASNWYAPYVQWAVDNGIVEGYGDGKFGPNNKITHQQMYVIMYRYTTFIAKKSVTLPTGAYISAIDADDVADWALKETKFASENDYLVKTGSRIEPAAEATRAELATLLLSYCKNVLGWENGKK